MRCSSPGAQPGPRREDRSIPVGRGSGVLRKRDRVPITIFIGTRLPPDDDRNRSPGPARKEASRPSRR